MKISSANNTRNLNAVTSAAVDVALSKSSGNTFISGHMFSTRPERVSDT